MSILTIPPTYYQVAWNADPNQSAVPPYWTDISARVQFPWSADRGRHYELDVVETGEWRPILANNDGALDPTNTASPFAPNVVPYRQARVLCLPGINQLTPDQATAGEGSGYGPGPVPPQTNVTCGAGYPLSYVASGTAFQGTQVYQVAVPNGAATPKDLLDLALVPALPNVAYAAQVQARVLATAQNLTVSVAIDWYNSAAAVISTTVGAGVALTGGSTSWIRLSASGTAPTGTVYCKIRAILGTTTSATALPQFDGIQFEPNPFPTPFQVPNTASANLLPRNIATGGYALGTAAGWWYPAYPPLVGITPQLNYATGLTAAPTGHTNAAAWTTPSGATAFWPLLFGGAATGPCSDVVQAVAGSAYTFSFYGLRAASADATLAVTPSIVWYTAAGSAISTSSGAALTLSTTVWGRAVVTGTAPAGAVWGRPQTTITTPGGGTTVQNTIWATAAQFEQAGAASTWQDPGNAYQVITPYVERWPQVWTEQNGTYGTDEVVAVDAFAGLSQYTLPSPFVAEVLALGPNFLFQLNDPTGATACADTAGRRTAAPVENSPFGAGSLSFGNPVAATTVPSGGFVGGPGPVATFNNNSSRVPPNQYPETFVSIHKTAAVPGPPTASPWTRVIAFRASTAPASSHAYYLWTSLPPSFLATPGRMVFSIASAPLPAGQLSIGYVDDNATVFSYLSGVSVCDGNWHLVAVSVDPAGGASTMWLDGAVVASTTGLTRASGMVSDALGCDIQPGAGLYDNGYVGDLAFATEFPFQLSNTQMTNLYNSWRTASSGDSSGDRVQRVLNWIGWTGPTAIDIGSTASMGPATDLAGATALDALNNIALTENGTFYASSAGVLTFKARDARYGQTTPVYVFGEQQSAGEWPFEYLRFENDPTHIMNSVQVTQYGGATVTAVDAASKVKSFPRAYQRTVNSTSLPECQDAATYLLGQNKGARQRVETLTLHPSAVPGLFLVCLNLEIGTRIRVNRRPNGAPADTFDGFVEKIVWQWNPDTGDVYVTLQCSPADLAKYWVLGALHTTLAAQATAGSASATINALPDAAVNRLASSLPVGNTAGTGTGYVLIFEPGTPRLEANYISSVPSTALGYASATVNFMLTFAFTHPAGSVVCDALPVGATDPTAWDASSVLGVSYATILSGGAVGTNTVTVGPLPDSAVNALGSNWNTGDVVWLSPGVGARAEAMTILSVSTTYPGYTSAVITFTTNIGLVHNVGEYVSDPLANNSINPSTVAATTRPAY